ncbi:MAG: hypothetical protein ACUVQI_04135 [Thermochromatium sp.]
MPNITSRHLVLAIAVPVFTMVWQPVLSASECKGLSQEACIANEQCRWMEGYTRKDGVQVSSHCRLAKPRPKPTTEGQANAPADIKPEMAADTPPKTTND